MNPGPIDLSAVDDVLRAAVKEDLGSGDVTTRALIPDTAKATGRFTAKQPLVVAGLPVTGRLLKLIDPTLLFRPLVQDGESVEAGSVLAEVRGAASSILSGERVSLNMLQRMCGIATLARQYVDRVHGTKARIVDTRKTVPGLRVLDKYAVKCGGAFNHRMGLFDAILIKNNHLAFHSSIGEAVRAARQRAGPKTRIEVEVTGMQQIDPAIDAGANTILLDNFNVEQTREAVRKCKGRVRLESSGGITLETVRDYAEAGVDIISVGALTHSPAAADIHLRVAPV